ncbi:hypothetical protein MD484_g5223, partial [Candolleomyces efflorescens]
MADAFSNLREVFFRLLAERQVSQYLDVACCTLMVADYLHTFPREVKLIWPARWTLPKALFLIVRYYGLVNVAFALSTNFPSPGTTPSTCKAMLAQVGVSCAVLVILSDAILFVRLYGFSGRDKRILALSVVPVGLSAATSAPLVKFLRSVLYIDSPIPSVPCLQVAGEYKLLGAVFTLALSNGIIAMLGMMVIMYYKYKTNRSSLIKAFYRDGIGYFVFLGGKFWTLTAMSSQKSNKFTGLAVTNIVLNFAPIVCSLHPRCGMPTVDPSSTPLSLTSVPATEAYLANTPFTGESVTFLTGGLINYLYRVQLLVPIQGHRTVILKHAQPVTRDLQDAAWDLKRQMFEVEAMMRVKQHLSSSSTVTIPEIYHFDTHNAVIIMEACGPNAVTLAQYLSSSQALSSSCTDTAKAIGIALGEFISSIHEWSRGNPGGILDRFDDNIQGKESSANFYYDRLASTLDHSDKEWGVLAPLLADVEVDPAKIELVSTLAQGYRSNLFSKPVPGRDVFVMGDLWDGNILVGDHGPNLRIFVIDWEIARTDLPGSDVGVFCGGINFLVRGGKAASNLASVIVENFIDAYARCSPILEDSLAQDSLFHWGAYYVFWAARYPPGGKEVIQALVKEGVDLLLSSRDTEFLAQSPVRGLLPK